MADTRLRALIESSFDGKGTEQAAKGFKEVGAAGDQAATGGVDKLTTGTGNLTGVLTKLAAGGLLIQIGQAALEFGKASIQAASDAGEMQAKFDVVFGSSAPQAQAALEDLAGQVNRSATELQGMSASIQDTFVPMGFARDEAAKLSVELTKLAVDVGSFNNVADADVMRDFQSALVGNTETVRKYGIVITEANTKQKAYAMGIAEVGSELTEQQKVQARLQLIMEGTTDAQGDAIRTADSYANAQKGLQAAVNDLQIALGTMATEVLAPVVVGVTQLINNLTNLTGSLESVHVALETQWQSAVKNNLTYEEYIDSLGAAGFAVHAFGTIIGSNLEMRLAEEQRIQGVINATEKSTDAVDENVRALTKQRNVLSDVNKELNLTKQGQYEFTEATNEWNNTNTYVTAGMNMARDAVYDYKKSAEEAANETKRGEQAMSDLQLFMQGPLGGEYDAFITQNQSLEASAEELRLKIQELGGTEFMTDEQVSKISALQNELNGVTTEIVQFDDAIKSGELSDNKELEATQNVEDLRQKAWELEQQIIALGGTPFATAANAEELAATRDELAQTNDAIAANAEAHSLATKQILLNLAMQRAAMDGITTAAESEVLINLAFDWGLIDEKTRDASLAADKYWEDLNSGKATVEETTAAFINYQGQMVANEDAVAKLDDILITSNDDLAEMRDVMGDLEGMHQVGINVSVTGDPIPSIGGTGTVDQGKPGTATELDTGGIIPGAFSQPVPIIAHGSEMVLNPTQQSNLFALLNGGNNSSGGSVAPIIYVMLDGQQIAAAIEIRSGQRARQVSGAYRP